MNYLVRRAGEWWNSFARPDGYMLAEVIRGSRVIEQNNYVLGADDLFQTNLFRVYHSSTQQICVL